MISAPPYPLPPITAALNRFTPRIVPRAGRGARQLDDRRGPARKPRRIERSDEVGRRDFGRRLTGRREPERDGEAPDQRGWQSPRLPVVAERPAAVPLGQRAAARS